MTAVAGVLDLSFYDIVDEADIEKALSEKEKEKEKMKKTLIATGKKTGKLDKVDEIKAIRFSNNQINDLSIIFSPLVSAPSVNLDISKLAWVDLSFNNIQSISAEWFESVPNLCTLNIHANQISKLSDLKKLTVLKKLRSLTMCGNPVADCKHYRNMIIYFCSDNLVQLDFGCITNSEKQKVAIWEQVYRKKLYPEDH